MGHSFMPKYLVLGETPQGSRELRLFKSRWQHRLAVQDFSESPLLTVPLTKVRACHRVQVKIPRSKSSRKEEEDHEGGYQFEVFLREGVVLEQDLALSQSQHRLAASRHHARLQDLEETFIKATFKGSASGKSRQQRWPLFAHGDHFHNTAHT